MVLIIGAPNVCVYFGPCFVMQYIVFFLVLQHSHRGRGSRLLYFMFVLVVLMHGSVCI